jgi:TP901 family phage tail tape measure protein
MPSFSPGGALHMVASLNPFPFKGGIAQVIGGLDKFTGILRLAGVGLAIFGAVQLVRATQEAEKFELQVANLAKLLGRDAARPLAKSISDMGKQLPVARDRLFSVAETAARLGVRGSRNIKEFVNTMALIDVTTDMSANAAANAFARIAAVTKTPISDVRLMANEINTLSNNMATSFSEIVNSAGEIAPVLSNMGASNEEIFAIAAATNEVNISVKRGARRIRSFFQQITDPDKMEKFAKTLGMTRGELEKFIREGEGSVALLAGIVKVLRDGGEAADVWRSELQQAGRQALESTNIESLEKAFRLVNEQMEKNNSLQVEYAEFADTSIAMTVRMENTLAAMRTELGEQTLSWKKFYTQAKINVFSFWGDVIEEWKHGSKVLAVAALAAGDIDLSDMAESYKELSRVLSEDQITPFSERLGKVAQAMRNRGLEVPNGMQEGWMALFASHAAFLNNLDPELLPGYFAAVKTAMDPENIDFSFDVPSQINNFLVFGLRVAQSEFNKAQRAAAEFRDEAEDAIRKTSYEAELLNPILALMDKNIKNASDETKEAAAEFALLQIRLNEGADAARVAELRLEGLGAAEALETVALENRVKAIQKVIDSEEERAKKVVSLGEKLQNALLKEGETWVERTEAMLDHLKVKDEVLRGEYLHRAALLDLREAQDEEQKRLDNLNQSYEKQIRELRILAIKYQLGEEAAEEFEARLDGYTYVQLAALRAERARVASLREMREGIDAAANAQEKWNEKLTRLSEQADLSNVETQVEFMADLAREISSAFTDTFEDLIDGSKSVGQAMAEMFARIVKDAFEAWLTLQLFQGIFKLAGGGGGGGGGGGNVLSFGLFAGMGVGSNAEGGPVPANKMTVVGEKGPELFIPDTYGRIIPNDDLRDTMGLGGGGAWWWWSILVRRSEQAYWSH